MTSVLLPSTLALTLPPLFAAASSLSLWDLVVAGGWAMWPLGGCSLALMFLLVYVWRETREGCFLPPGGTAAWSERLAERDVDGALPLLAADGTVLARALEDALERARPGLPDANKERVESALAERLEEADGRFSALVNYLNVVATIAPMIGLLGTVSGMIGAFQTISAGGMGRPELLAGDIGEALITTAAGLIIGIPAMVAYFILRNRLNRLLGRAAQEATRLVDLLAGDRVAPAGSARPVC